MVTVTCKLTLQNGDVITGTVSAEMAELDYNVHYTGNVNKLPEKLDRASVSYLVLNFENWANELNAKLEVSESGHYDMVVDGPQMPYN